VRGVHTGTSCIAARARTAWLDVIEHLCYDLCLVTSRGVTAWSPYLLERTVRSSSLVREVKEVQS